MLGMPLIDRFTNLALVIVMLVHIALLGWSAASHSPTFDEIGHLPAGISHWQLGEFDLFRVNPPLIRSVAAVPVLLSDAQLDWDSYEPSDTRRADFAVGKDFIVANGVRVFKYFTMARWMCIPFSLLGAVVCWIWARDLYGNASGLVALVLWCFCPNVLGHGALLTPDIGAATLGLAASYAYWRWLRSGLWTAALVAGVLLGLAQLTKTTCLILVALWPVLWLVWGLVKSNRTRREWCKQSLQLCWLLVVALYVLNLGYGFDGSFTRLRDYPFISRALGGGTVAESTLRRPDNRFSDMWPGAVPVPLPKDYLLGIDHQKRNFEAKFWSYLRGQPRQRGWYHYYLYGMFVKIPLGVWFLGVLAFATAVPPRGWLKLADRSDVKRAVSGRSWLDEVVLLTPGILLLSFVSYQTGINKHLRYVLPAFPYLFIWVSRVAAYADFTCAALRGKRWAHRRIPECAAELPQRGILKSPARATVTSQTLMGASIAALLSWSIGSSLYVFPHSISYFNEIAGGPRNGHWHLGTSNTDWGQDLFYLLSWYRDHPDARPLNLKFSLGLLDPRILGIEHEPVPYGPTMNRPGHPKSRTWYWREIVRDIDSPPAQRPLSNDPAKRGPLPGWFAIGVNEIHDPGGNYEYFLEFDSIASAGYSINIYHLTVDEVNRLRKRLQLEPLPHSPPSQSSNHSEPE